MSSQPSSLAVSDAKNPQGFSKSVKQDKLRRVVSAPLRICPFDGRHRFPPGDEVVHLRFCPSRSLLIPPDANGNDFAQTDFVAENHQKVDSIEANKGDFERRKSELETRYGVKLPVEVSEAQLAQLSSESFIEEEKFESTIECRWCDGSVMVENNFDSILRHSLAQHIRLGRYVCRRCQYDANEVDQMVNHLSQVHKVDNPKSTDFADRFDLTVISGLKLAEVLIGQIFDRNCRLDGEFPTEDDDNWLMRSQFEFELISSAKETPPVPPLTTEQIRLAKQWGRRGTKSAQQVQPIAIMTFTRVLVNVDSYR